MSDFNGTTNGNKRGRTGALENGDQTVLIKQQQSNIPIQTIGNQIIAIKRYSNIH